MLWSMLVLGLDKYQLSLEYSARLLQPPDIVAHGVTVKVPLELALKRVPQRR